MKIKVNDYSGRYYTVFVTKIDEILTGRHHMKLIVVDLNELPF